MSVNIRNRIYLLAFTSIGDSNHLAHPRSLIRVFVVRMKKFSILGYPKYAQADLNRRREHMSKDTFSDGVVHMYMGSGLTLCYLRVRLSKCLYV